jgi:hypothetical protein
LFCKKISITYKDKFTFSSGEHGGQAIHKLVNAVNIGKHGNHNEVNTLDCLVSVTPRSNDKIINSLVTSSSVNLSNGIVIHDSVIVDIELVKQSSNNQSKPQQRIRSNLDQESTESVNKKKIHHENGFPTSSMTQFWVLLKRAFLTIIRDQTLTQMRLVSHVVVGAIIGMIYYKIG